MTEQSNEQVIDPKLVAKIRNMLAMAKHGGSNENEADTAARMAQELMLKHNISMAQVDSIGGEQQEGGKRSKQRRKGNAMYKFQQLLMAACAEVNFVYQEVRYEYTNGHRRAKGYTLIGREANVVATQILFDYLASTCENLGIEYVDHDNRRRMSIEALSFKEGCATRIGERLRERHESQLNEQKREARERNAAARHPSNAGTALVVVMEDYAQAEADRNNDLRLNRPEGTTAAKRLAATQESEIDHAIVMALNSHYSSKDRDLLSVAIDAAIEVLFSNRGWSMQDESLAAMVAKEARLYMDSHVRRLEKSEAELARRASLTDKQREAEDRKAAREYAAWEKRYNARQNRGYSSGPERNIDYRAYRAGSAAGDKVGLDKQVNREDRKAIK